MLSVTRYCSAPARNCCIVWVIRRQPVLRPTRGTDLAQGMDEAAGALVEFRLAADAGNYHRVDELSANSGADELNASYTLRDVVGKARAGGECTSGYRQEGLVSGQPSKDRRL